MKILLFIMTAVAAFTSTVLGLLMISNPDGSILHLSPDLLNGTPFADYLVPGILLTVITGGVNLVAVFYSLQRHPSRYNWTMTGGFVIIGWIVVQMILMETVHWPDFICLGGGILIVLVSYQLKGKWLA